MKTLTITIIIKKSANTLPKNRFIDLALFNMISSDIPERTHMPKIASIENLWGRGNLSNKGMWIKKCLYRGKYLPKAIKKEIKIRIKKIL